MKPTQLRKTLLATVIALCSLTVNTAVFATVSTALDSTENTKAIATARTESKADLAYQTEWCGDPDNEGSLAAAQQEVVEEKKQLSQTPMDVGAIFKIAKGSGCFAALSEFPDLSVSIPSITSILNALQTALEKYAVRKVCSAMNSALATSLEPLNNAVQNLSNSGQLDLNGQVNKTLAKKLYSVDPTLGAVTQSATADQTITFSW